MTYVGGHKLVFIPFHWVFQGKEGKGKKKERKKGEIVENQAHFICPPKSILWCYTIDIYISVLNLVLLYQPLIPDPLATAAVHFFPLSTPLHPLTCPHFLQATLHTSGQLKISLLPGQLSLKQRLHFRIVCHLRSFVIRRRLFCISVCLRKIR